MPKSVVNIQQNLKLDEKTKNIILKELPRDKLMWMLKNMYLTRFFEENAEALYIRGLVHGTMHLSIGMEASPIGSIAAIEKNDYILHHHRGHGHTIVKGADLTLMTAEFLGKDSGYNRGRGGSQHIADIGSRNLGATGIVGSMFATAVGIGLSLQMHNSKDILLCFFGDGSTNEGEFHEALNMAALWKVPVVFICDNNQYGMSMAIEKVASVPCIAQRVSAYGIPSTTVDGNDVLAVYNAVSQAVKKVKAGEGPQMVENLTYRWRGHSKSDRNLYRTPEEIAEWQKNDPIVRFGNTLKESKILTSEEIESIEKLAQDEIQKAAETAILMPEPTPESMEEEVYAL